MNADLSGIRGWVFDVDGCLIRTTRAGGRGGTALPGGSELLTQLEDAGHRVIVCTNASEYAPAVYAEHLREAGLPLRDEDFVTAGSATADHIHAHHPGARVLVIGSDGLTQPLLDLGVPVVEPGGPEPDVVVVGASSTYTTADLNAGALAVDRGAALYSTVDTPWFSGGMGRSLAVSAAIAASITYATGRRPIVGGKPSAVLAESLLRRLDLPAAQTAVVGDAIAETRLARRMGGTAVLVLGGATAEYDIASLPETDRPDVVVDDVAVLRHRLAPHLTRKGAQR